MLWVNIIIVYLVISSGHYWRAMESDHHMDWRKRHLWHHKKWPLGMLWNLWIMDTLGTQSFVLCREAVLFIMACCLGGLSCPLLKVIANKPNRKLAQETNLAFLTVAWSPRRRIHRKCKTSSGLFQRKSKWLLLGLEQRKLLELVLCSGEKCIHQCGTDDQYRWIGWNQRIYLWSCSHVSV